MFLININRAVDGRRARIFHSMYRTIDAVFPHTYVFAKDRRLWAAEDSRNIILLAVNGVGEVKLQRYGQAFLEVIAGD